MPVLKLLFLNILFVLLINHYSNQTDEVFALEVSTTSALAYIDDSIITTYDLSQRINLLLLTGQLSTMPKQIEQQEILYSMIDGRIAQSYAKKINLSIQRDKIKRRIDMIRTSNNVSIRTLKEGLKKGGVTQEEMITYIKEQLVIEELMHALLRDESIVTESEIDERSVMIKQIALQDKFLSKKQEALLQTKVNIAEIAVPLAQADHALKKIATKIRNGENFLTIAKEFSTSLSAQNGGLLGWMYLKELNKQYLEVVMNTAIGGISQPFVVGDNVHIIHIIEMKSPKQQPSSAELELAIAKLANSKDNSNITSLVSHQERDKFKQLMQSIKRSMEIRDFMNRLRKNSVIKVMNPQ